MHPRSRLLAFGLSLCALATATAHASGDPARGRVLVGACKSCHGAASDNNSDPVHSVPKLRGQHAPYIVAALKQYRAGDRSHPTLQAPLSSFSEQDLEDMAAYLQGEGVKSTAQVRGTPPASTSVCFACHGNGGVGLTSDFPTLAGQYPDYLAQSLRDYKSGKRKNAVMMGMVLAIKDEDIPAVAAFFSQQKGLEDWQ